MATRAVQLDLVEELPSAIPKQAILPNTLDLGLEEMTSNPAWKEMLFELVYSEGFDPWNIEIGRLCTAYVSKVRSLKTLDLHVPANVILAASILLRLKSDAFSIEEETQATDAQIIPDEESTFDPSGVPAVSLSGRIPPKRQFTLEELTAALETVFARQKEKQEKILAMEKSSLALAQIPLPVSEFDIEKEMEELFSGICSKKDSEDLVLFSSLLSGGADAQKIVWRFLALLHLVQHRRVTASQENFFGEIVIMLPAQAKMEAKIKGKPSGQAKSAG